MKNNGHTGSRSILEKEISHKTNRFPLKGDGRGSEDLSVAVVLGGGDYPTHPMPLRLLQEAETVVCCDGAAMEYIRKEGKAPWRIVGDGDSLSTEFKAKYADIIRQETEQETNDQTKATRYLARHGFNRIIYLGATGKREDHTLGNISWLVDYMHKGLDVRMYTDHGMFIPCTGSFTAEVTPGTQVSIFSFGAKNLHAEGLKYPLSDFTNWWQGTLNEVVAPNITIDAEGDYLVFINY